MPRPVVGGLMQAATPLMDPTAPIGHIRQAAIDVSLSLIAEAGNRAVGILGLHAPWNIGRFDASSDGVESSGFGPMAEQLP
jgi:hypothetical protein